MREAIKQETTFLSVISHPFFTNVSEGALLETFENVIETTRRLFTTLQFHLHSHHLGKEYGIFQKILAFSHTKYSLCKKSAVPSESLPS